MILIELEELNRRLAERFCFNCTKDCTFCEIKEVGRITERMPIYRAEDSVSTYDITTFSDIEQVTIEARELTLDEKLDLLLPPNLRRKTTPMVGLVEEERK